MAFGDVAGGETGLDLVAQRQEAHGVGYSCPATAYPSGDRLLAHAELLGETPVCLSLFERAQVLALEVLDQRQFKPFVCGGLFHDDGYAAQAGQAGRPQRFLDLPCAKVTGDSGSVKRAAFGIIAWAMAFWLGIVLVGFHVAAPLYLYCQLVIYGEVKKWIAALGAMVCLLIIIFVYDRLAETTWNDPLLFDLVKDLFSI